MRVKGPLTKQNNQHVKGMADVDFNKATEFLKDVLKKGDF